MVAKKACKKSGGRGSNDCGGSGGPGLVYSSSFLNHGQDPYYTDRKGDTLEYVCHDVEKKNAAGEVIFSQSSVEVPRNFSYNATEIIATKYLYGSEDEAPGREGSLKQLVGRVSGFVGKNGLESGYFSSEEGSSTHERDVAWLMTNQCACFNSPVMFNAGLYDSRGAEGNGKGHFRYDEKKGKVVEMKAREAYKYPQSSACFIEHIGDDLDDIMNVASQEARLFKDGSGAGADLTTIRSSHERLSNNGRPSGPLSFMEIYDSTAGVVKSGGKTRRAAKMQSLKVYHPDIREFIMAKPNEERKAWALIEQGYDGSFDGEAYNSIKFQNANLSVRVTDEFMEGVEKGGKLKTVPVHSSEMADEMPEYDAGEVMSWIADATHICGDPGVQYDDTINEWHTCPNSGRINASNPCSEYMFVDNSACNLASLNLMKFRNEDGSFNVKDFQAAVRAMIISQDILVDASSYPSKEIAENSHRFRPLGLGYANLGAFVMSNGLSYDSDGARDLAAKVTSLMTATAYQTSAEIAAAKGAFEGFEENREPMLNVIGKHKDCLENLISEGDSNKYIADAAREAWESAQRLGGENGFRNAQVSVLAPTGTIGFLMDCDTLGVEPDIALVKYKQLVGGGMMKLVNGTVPQALKVLKYSPDQIESIVNHIGETDTIEGAPYLKEEHLPVFDCAFKPANGERSLAPIAHLKMMAAVQPSISGAISKTVNVPEETTKEEIQDIYMQGWKMGLKAVAVYRDNSKGAQPLETKNEAERKNEGGLVGRLNMPVSKRVKLPKTSIAVRHQFNIATTSGQHGSYVHFGLFDDGTLGEIFLTSGDEGSEVRGMADAYATAFSLLLQHGAPLGELIDKFSNFGFPPEGLLVNGTRKGVLDELSDFDPMSTRSIPAYVMGLVKDNFMDDDGNECAYKPYAQMGLFGKDKKTVASKDDKKEDSENGTEGRSREELMKQVNMECTHCGGPAIKRGRCDSFCVNEMKFYPGSCGGE